MGTSDLLKHVQNMPELSTWTVSSTFLRTCCKPYDMFSCNGSLRITSLVQIFYFYLKLYYLWIFSTQLKQQQNETKEATNYVLKDTKINLAFAKLPVI